MGIFETATTLIGPAFNLLGLIFMIILLFYGIYQFLKGEAEQGYNIIWGGCLSGITFLTAWYILGAIDKFKVNFWYILLLIVYVILVIALEIFKPVIFHKNSEETEEEIAREIRKRKSIIEYICFDILACYIILQCHFFPFPLRICILCVANAMISAYFRSKSKGNP